jgi:hypothetical protein
LVEALACADGFGRRSRLKAGQVGALSEPFAPLQDQDRRAQATGLPRIARHVASIEGAMLAVAIEPVG